MKMLLTICARGGSKGVPQKNTRSLVGKPLIVHSIEQAFRWGRADQVVVSTDSPEIAAVARDFGASVPFMRPAALATDIADKLTVIRHALQESESYFATQFDIVVDLDATAPLRTVEDLENCYRLFEKGRPDTLFSVVSSHKNPYFNMVELDEKERPHLCKVLPKAVHRRQDAPKVYDMNASIYFFQRKFLLETNYSSVVTKNSQVYVMSEITGFDIDREVDFHFVESLIEKGYFML